MNIKSSKEEKIRSLLESREKTIRRLRQVEKRMREEEEDSEETWPGHDSTRYHLTQMEYQVLLSHLAEVEKELKELKGEK